MESLTREFYLSINEMEFDGSYEMDVETGDLGVPRSPMYTDITSIRICWPMLVNNVWMTEAECRAFLGPLQMRILESKIEECAKDD